MRLNVHPWIVATTSVALACGWIVLGEHSDNVPFGTDGFWRVATGVAAGHADPGEPGLEQQFAQYQSLLAGDAFARLARVEAELPDPVSGLVDDRIIGADGG